MSITEMCIRDRLEDIEKFNAAELPVQCVNELKAQIDHVDESIILPSRWQKP